MWVINLWTCLPLVGSCFHKISILFFSCWYIGLPAIESFLPERKAVSLLILHTIFKLSRLDWCMVSFYINLLCIHFCVSFFSTLHQRSRLVDFISTTLIVFQFEAHVQCTSSMNITKNITIDRRSWGRMCPCLSCFVCWRISLILMFHIFWSRHSDFLC